LIPWQNGEIFFPQEWRNIFLTAQQWQNFIFDQFIDYGHETDCRAAMRNKNEHSQKASAPVFLKIQIKTILKAHLLATILHDELSEFRHQSLLIFTRFSGNLPHIHCAIVLS
jgi:hypothetical protein